MKNTVIRRFALSLGYLLSVHAVALVIFGIFRLVLFLTTNYQFPEEIQGKVLLQSMAFVKGLWFDNVIACYILIFPLVVMWIAGLFKYTAKWLYRVLAVWFIVLYSVAFSFTAANIPYFEYFFKVINSSIFNWFGYAGTTAGMIVGESSYYFPLALGFVSILVFGFVTWKLANKFYLLSQHKVLPYSLKDFAVVMVTGIVLCGLCCFGIRGCTGIKPIKVGQAYYCSDPFLNQLGINPVFNLLASYLEDKKKENKQLDVMPVEEALANVQRFLGREGIDGISPIAKEVVSPISPTGKNVVFIFMESMSANLLGAYGNKGGLTPFLDSLMEKSLVFNNIYSAGIHTNQGMYSTLYSFPTIMMRNAMKGTVIPVYSGLPTVLAENGYHNMFFMTHEKQYDNMNGFFRTNGFEEIYSMEDYPKEKIVNKWGVQDDYLYEFALPVLNKRAAEEKPFFAVLLSISNHPPYVLPDYYQPRSSNIEEQIVEYADWSLRKLMTDVSKEPWYDNTIFVLMGDHGKLVGTPECEIPKSYNHVPLMIFGKDIEPAQIDGFGGQIDVAPTLLGMLGISYTKNNLGVNLLQQQRPCIAYTADNLIAARCENALYVYVPDTEQEFRYIYEDGKIRLADDDDTFKMLKEYCFSMLQSTEYLVRNQMITDKPVQKEGTV